MKYCTIELRDLFDDYEQDNNDIVNFNNFKNKTLNKVKRIIKGIDEGGNEIINTNYWTIKNFEEWSES